MDGIGLEIIGYLVLPIITWTVAHYVGYSLLVVNTHNISSIVLMIIVSPVLEEVIFRGMLQDFFLKFIRNGQLAIVMLNLGFALMHYRINANLLYLLAVFICGMIFSRLKVRLGNLIYPIGMHVYYNLVLWIANS